MSVLANWLWNYVTYKRGARLITGERSWDLLPVIAGHAKTKVLPESLGLASRPRAPLDPEHQDHTIADP